MWKPDAKNYRPAFIVVDPEHAGSISTRKLLLETAKLNVLTCYSGTEAVATLRRFPNVDAIVLNVDVRDMDCSELVRQMKTSAPTVPVVLVSPAGYTSNCNGVDHQVSSYEPKELLDLFQKLFGKTTSGE
ncbi:MAG TPA: response regulator [Candidatus Angelobacter sp.]|nr:response regulator [Candidatus Angelobacter sp.]